MTSEYKGPPRFVFLEFLEPEINGLLCGLRKEFGYDSSGSDIHITVRGPYTEWVPQNEIEKYQEILEKEPILIHGVGVFENSTENVVYIKISSNQLKQIWWKPDYPKEKYGFNPHITLHKGKDKNITKDIYVFLRKEGIKLISHNFRLVLHSSKQRELFPADDIPKERQFLNLTNRRIVRTNILQRASDVISKYKSAIDSDKK